MGESVQEPVSVWKCGPDWYSERRAGHPELWEFVRQFIDDHKIKSMLEIGGGDGVASELVERYCCVDVNHVAVEAGRDKYPGQDFLHRDWLADPAPADYFPGRCDLVLACAVVEHMPHWQPCVEKMLKVRSRYAVVSFFRGLLRDRDEIKQVESTDASWSQSGGVYYDNAYSGVRVAETLDAKRLDWKVHLCGTDAVLVINNG